MTHSEKIITVCNVVYFRLCIGLMHILTPVTAEGFDGSHHPRFAECLSTVPTFEDPDRNSLKQIVGKKRKCWEPTFFFIPVMSHTVLNFTDSDRDRFQSHYGVKRENAGDQHYSLYL